MSPGCCIQGKLSSPSLTWLRSPSSVIHFSTQKYVGSRTKRFKTCGDGFRLLAPMGEVAGRLGTQIGAQLLLNDQGCGGLLLGGVPGVR
jgi:alanine dehydrogenase